jgi:hypothetical protein
VAGKAGSVTDVVGGIMQRGSLHVTGNYDHGETENGCQKDRKDFALGR